MYYFPDGRSYVGYFKDNLKDGYGTLSYLDGAVYQGNFKDD